MSASYTPLIEAPALPDDLASDFPSPASCYISAGNSSTVNLTSENSYTFTGAAEQTDHPDVMLTLKTDQVTAISLQFSHDGVNWDSQIPKAGAAGSNEFTTAVKGNRYFRVVVTTANLATTYFRLQVQFGQFRQGNLSLNSTISSDADALVTRSVLVGATDGGHYVNVPATPEGHLEVAVHGPLNPFGSVHVESLTPIIQIDAIYGANASSMTPTTGLSYDPGPAIGPNSGSNTVANNMFVSATGATAYSFAANQSVARLRYRPGQGIVGRFTALWSDPAASSITVAGFGSGESGVFFGYNGTSFGILQSTSGVREIQTFTVSAATSTGGTVTFRLNGLDTQVTLATAATTTLTANNIATQTFPGWSVEARGATVIFLADSVGNKAGAFSITLGSAVGTAGSFTETLAGAAAIDTWIPQASWNGDVCDGTGNSGFTLVKTKGNVFQIGVAWLGFGPITFSILMGADDGNNASWAVVHTINNPNTRTTPHTSQPSYPFTMAAYSSGSTTNVSVSVASIAGFVEGQKRLNGPRLTYFNTAGVTSSTSAYVPIVTVRNDLVYSTRANQGIINLVSLGGAAKSTNGITSFYVIKNATLTGPVSFTQWSTTSMSYADTGATGCTFSNNNQVVWVGTVSETGQFTFSFTDDILLQPGETMTLAVRSVTATAVCVGQLNTREDQ